MRKVPSRMIWSSPAASPSQMLKPRPTTSIVGCGLPGGAGVSAVGVAEGDMDAGELFILEDVADDALDADVGADGELADAVGVGVGVGVGPEIFFEGLVSGGGGGEAVGFDFEGEWGVVEEAVAGA